MYARLTTHTDAKHWLTDLGPCDSWPLRPLGFFQRTSEGLGSLGALGDLLT